MKNLLTIIVLMLLCSCANPSKKQDQSTLLPPTRKTIPRRSTAAFSPLVAKQWRFEWDYSGPGPIWFEVWHSTNLSQFSWLGDTNVPTGFTLFVSTDKTNGTTFSVPINPIKPAEFYIVRAVNEFGPSPWAR
jgi:hypothetical protein